MYRYETAEDKMYNGAIYGAIVAVIVCLVWYNWAMNTYKNSPERIGDLCLLKYQLDQKNSEKLADATAVASDVVVSADGKSVTLSVNIKPNKTAAAVSQPEKKTYQISDTCQMTDLTCIKLS